MNGSRSTSRRLGCPCGHSIDADCARHRPPLPHSDPACARYGCRSWGLSELKTLSELFGVCPCTLERNSR